MIDPFQRAHLADLERMAEEASNDPVLGPASRARLEHVRAELTAGLNLFAAQPPVSQAAFFLQGKSVNGMVGIDSNLAGQVLTEYAAMFAVQAVMEERRAAVADGQKRRPQGAIEPTLLFTGTPRGSFGFEFAPATGDQTLASIHANALDHLVRLIINVADDSGTPEQQAPVGVLPYLKRFFKALADHDVSLRVVTQSGFRQSLAADRVQATAQRLEREVSQENMTVLGTFRGITLDTGHFDIKPDDDSVISGMASDDLEDADLIRIHALTDQPCEAHIERTVIRRVGRQDDISYVLLDARPRGSASAGG